MAFTSELKFEDALVKLLKEKKGWKGNILSHPSENDLLHNWAQILFENNRGIDRLNDQPLTKTEMQQIVDQIITLHTPVKLNGFINGKTVSIKRDNPNDALHYNKEVSLKIYDRNEIAAGQSRYQIAEQPIFKTDGILNDRRGDIMLLINGMPVIHLELKKSGIPVSQACNQIEKYAHEGVFTGIFSLIQVFVAMTPEETLYFANPGPDGIFNRKFFFHWADFNNNLINEWEEIADKLLSIPMAHELIGFYTVADDTDNTLKVMRSYQYYAASSISKRVSMLKSTSGEILGGYIWHTTGSGKTMTSFKSAQLIANSADADKVVFLVDRIELGIQSLAEYKAFADDSDDVQSTEDTIVLITKLKSTATSDLMIVTSIQKMSHIKEDITNKADFEAITKKRIVIIIDEAHRDTFGDMLSTIKNSFPNAIFFGFTGTPIFDENSKKSSVTSDVFGNELHRYSIADGIRDGNVLAFDPYKVLTYRDIDIRKAVAFDECKAEGLTKENKLSDIFADENKKRIYDFFMNKSKIAMAGHWDNSSGKWIKGIEDYLPTSQYDREEHRQQVVKDIKENFLCISANRKFHALFATSSILEAIKYYRLLKADYPELKCTTVFDPSIDNLGGSNLEKEKGIEETIIDYNARYGMHFTLGSYAKFKKDVAKRLAHKKPYQNITQEQSLDMVIVVDQMLTGYDSKYINCLYLDKLLKYQNIIQAFSRTNRIFGHDKPFGVIRYYRKPHTMEVNIEKAIRLYSGDKPFSIYVNKLPFNLKGMNSVYDTIELLFKNEGIKDFVKLPDDKSACAKFSILFKQLNDYLEAAKIQGFSWNTLTYAFKINSGKEKIILKFDENTYSILLKRYKDLSRPHIIDSHDDVPYDIDGYITSIDTGTIDAEYMNSRFNKYLKALQQENITESDLNMLLDEVHKTFATLSQDEQKYANIFINDVQSGDIQITPGKTCRDYITEYMCNAKNKQIHDIADAFGLDEGKLQYMMNIGVNESNINEFGRFDDLKSTVDKLKAKEFLEETIGKPLTVFELIKAIDDFLRKFIIKGL